MTESYIPSPSCLHVYCINHSIPQETLRLPFLQCPPVDEGGAACRRPITSSSVGRALVRQTGKLGDRPAPSIGLTHRTLMITQWAYTHVTVNSHVIDITRFDGVYGSSPVCLGIYR